MSAAEGCVSSSRLVVPDLGRELVVADVEGNGGTTPLIVEVATLRLPTDGGGEVTPGDVHSWLVRPRYPISPVVTHRVHGITNDAVADAPLWPAVADEVHSQLGARVLVAHSATVERDVLASHLPCWRPEGVLDTLRLARAVLPSVSGGHGLANLMWNLPLPAPLPPHAVVDDADDDVPAGRKDRAGRAGSPAGPRAWRRHRAAFDVWVTAALFVVLAAATGPDFTRLASLAATAPPRSPDRSGPDGASASDGAGVDGPGESSGGSASSEGLW